MATNDPKYVRLADHMADSVLADIAGGSGFVLSGRDVKEFPQDPAAQRFVRSRLVQGLLEPASRAEYQEVQEANESLAEAAGDIEPPPMQEGHIQTASAQAASRLAQARQQQANDDDDEDNTTQDNVDTLSSDEVNARLRAANQPTTGSLEARRARLRETNA